MTKPFLPPRAVPPLAARQKKPSGTEVAGTLLAVFIFVPFIVTLLWNYGATEVIEALGGADGNVNLLEGWCTVFFLSALGSLLRGKLAAE